MRNSFSWKLSGAVFCTVFAVNWKVLWWSKQSIHDKLEIGLWFSETNRLVMQKIIIFFISLLRVTSFKVQTQYLQIENMLPTKYFYILLQIYKWNISNIHLRNHQTLLLYRTRETYDEFFPRNFNLPLFVIVLFLSWACRFTWNRSSLLVLKSWATNFNQSD